MEEIPEGRVSNQWLRISESRLVNRYGSSFLLTNYNFRKQSRKTSIPHDKKTIKQQINKPYFFSNTAPPANLPLKFSRVGISPTSLSFRVSVKKSETPMRMRRGFRLSKNTRLLRRIFYCLAFAALITSCVISASGFAKWQAAFSNTKSAFFSLAIFWITSLSSCM